MEGIITNFDYQRDISNLFVIVTFSNTTFLSYLSFLKSLALVLILVLLDLFRPFVIIYDYCLFVVHNLIDSRNK